jgi:PHD/YefM family antitoxin component YafN of YafNO toxin-antitoxin module
MKYSFPIPQFFSVSDLQRSYPAILEKLSKTNQPITILKKNKAQAILLTPQCYEEMVSRLEKLEEQIAQEAIKTYKKEKKNKKLVTMSHPDELFK